jgi:hypothetical protein
MSVQTLPDVTAHTIAEIVQIPLRRRDGSIRTYAIIDAQDAALAGYRWSLNGGYATRHLSRKTGAHLGVALHREICGLVRGDGLEVDHINGDRLDNRRVNLRVVTRAENGQNILPHGKTSRHRGVCFSNGAWRAQLHMADRVLSATCATEEQAAATVRAWREEHFPFANEARSILPEVGARIIAASLRAQAEFLDAFAPFLDPYLQYQGTNDEDGITLEPSANRLTISFHGAPENQRVLLSVIREQLGGVWEVRSDEDSYRATRRVEGSVTVVLWADSGEDLA